MRPGRELDTRIARDIFGHEVWATNKVVHERTPEGKRPLRAYTREMEWAWEVASRMRITLVPLEDGQWFAFSHGGQGWSSPQSFIDFLQAGNFSTCGAAVGPDAPLVICEAALRAAEKARIEAGASVEREDAESGDAEEGNPAEGPLASNVESATAKEISAPLQ